ncbi:MAG: UDP-N-acetylmuramoyl-tripeptide--D-alanyl-D-alanine ligase [Alloprevotella sp.]
MNISELYAIFRQHPVVTTDTRNCPPDSLFFALRGANFDGNRFAPKALEAGCAYAVVDNAEVAAADDRMLLVPDVLEALQQLARLHRRTLRTPILQITGTNGKTTTKELTATVLARRHRVLFTEGNLNNHIGVPRTLLRLTPQHDIAVVETGANHPGEIRFLSEMVEADCGLITNVGKAHLEGFGSFEGVVRTKGELYDNLRSREDTFIFLDADNPHLRSIAHHLPAITYGCPESDADITGEVVSCTPYLHFRWRQREDLEWQEVQTRLIGSYNLTNALAAAAVGLRFGVSEEEVSAALAAYEPRNNRSELLRTTRNELIVDAYNANPTSMQAALQNFALIPHTAKMVILGGMRELGEASDEEHDAVLRRLSAMEVPTVWLVGEEMQAAVRRTADTGRLHGLRLFPDVEAVKAALRTTDISGRLILIKGSNGNRLFELPEQL